MEIDTAIPRTALKPSRHVAKSLTVNRARINLHSEVTVSFPDQPPAHATKSMIIHSMFFIATKYSCDCLMPLDINKYRHFLDDTSFSEERKSQFIQDVWTILESFVDDAFGIHPLQLRNGSEKNINLQGSLESLESKMSNAFDEEKYAEHTRLENQEKT